MIISSYNKDGIGDTLILMTRKSVFAEQGFETKEKITRIFKLETGETVGFNFFQVSDVLQLEGKGSVTLTTEQVDQLNDCLSKAGFNEKLAADTAPKFVVGEVKECVPHPDSDHLSITQIEVDQEQMLQIVCGAANIDKGQKVVVAKVGAMMPNGLVIWDGELRGEPSHGMVCSAKELGIENSEATKGILVLPGSAVTGEAFQVN